MPPIVYAERQPARMAAPWRREIPGERGEILAGALLDGAEGFEGGGVVLLHGDGGACSLGLRDRRRN